MLIGLTCITMSASFESFITLYLTNKFKLEPGNAAIVTSTYAAGTCLSVVLGGFLYTRLSKRGICITNLVCLLLLLIDVIILWSIEDITVGWAALILFIYGFGVTVPWYYPMSIYSIECGGKSHSGILSGILDGFSNIGAAGYSFGAAYLIGTNQWNNFFVLTGFCAFGALLFLGTFLVIDFAKPSPTKELDFKGTLGLFHKQIQPTPKKKDYDDSHVEELEEESGM